MTTIKGWPDKSRDAVMMMQKKYGEPQIVSEHLICWKDTGPFKFTKIMDKELPHDFPMAHTDSMEQGLVFKVPAEKVGELAMFDGSIIVDRTKGCLSSRCDKEENNMLALKLPHDIITGKRSVAGARKYFAKAAAGAIAGTMDALHAEAELQFRNRYGRSRYDGILRRNEEANPHSLIGGEYP